MNKDEALHMALNALEPDPELAEWYVEKHKEMAIKACKEALAQPERKWVGLTDEQIDQLVVFELGLDADADIMHNFARAIEAKLKQKNGYAEEKNT